MRRVVALTSVAVLGLTVAASGGAAPARDALIRPGIGIGKVRLGMTQAEVRAAMGRHDLARTQARGSGQRYVELIWEGGGDPDDYRTVALLGRPGALRVVLITTTRLTERTPNGYGPGTSTRTLLQKVSGIRCQIVERRDGRPLRAEFLVRREPGAPGETAFALGNWGGPIRPTTQVVHWVIVRVPGVESDLRFGQTPCRNLLRS